MIQQYTFTGLGRQIDCQGTFFRYESGFESTGVVEINLTIDGQNVGTFSPGDSMELPQSAKRWEIVPVSNACAGTVKVGSARITAQRLNGVVQTVDGAMERVKGGRSFWAMSSSGSAAGNYPFAHLYNKSTDKNLIITRLACITSTTQVVNAIVSGNTWPGASIYPGIAKKGGGTDSTAGELRMWNTNVISAMGSGKQVLLIGCAAGVSNYMAPNDQIILPPGWGLALRGAQNTEIHSGFEWFEE